MKKNVFLSLLFVTFLWIMFGCQNRTVDNTTTDTFDEIDSMPWIDNLETTTERLTENETLLHNAINGDQRPICGSYISGSYIEKPNKFFLIGTQDQVFFYVQEWEKYYPGLPGQDYFEDYFCGTIIGSSAWFFIRTPAQTGDESSGITNITMVKLNEFSGQQKEVIIPLHLEGSLGSIFCSMIDENNGFLFVFTYNYAKAKIQLECLMQTIDGGDNWNPIERNTSWCSWHMKDVAIVAHFFDENKGLIASRAISGGSLSHIVATLDGGVTWNSITIPYQDYDPELFYADDRYAELADFSYQDGQYTLKMRISYANLSPTEYIQFISTDLITWSLVKK